VLTGTHVGVESLQPEAPGGSIKVATARELANRLELAPFEGDRHLVVFDPAEALTEQALNALLKTLEEPRPGVHFVMLATALDALLPTILSRCMAIRLGRLGDRDVRAILARSFEASEHDPPSSARVDLAVRLGGGSAGLALELCAGESLEPSLGLLRALVTAADAGPRAIFAGEKSPLWIAWSAAVGPVKTGRPARERAVAGTTAELWLLHLRECLRGADGLPGVPAPRDRSPTALLRHLDLVQTLLEGLDRNPNVRLSLEQTLLEAGSSGA
jgi:DNA polymerase-3 subunit delta'